MLYLVLSNEQRNLFSGVSCHGNQENSVFVVSVTAIAKGKNPSAYFRKLTRASSQWEFQHKVSITSLEKVLEPVPLLPITRALDPTSWISHKFWDQLFPPIINVVCKYLRQFLGASSGFATISKCCNIE